MAVHSTPAHRRVSRFMQASLALAALLVLALMATARAGPPLVWYQYKRRANPRSQARLSQRTSGIPRFRFS